MSEPQAEATQGESGSVSAGSTVSPSSETSSEAAAAADLAVSVLQAPAVAPDREALPKDEIKKDEIKPEAKVEAPPVELPKRGISRATGKVLIMAPSDRTWHDHSADVKVEADARAKAAPKTEKTKAEKADSRTDKPKRSFPAMAAMLALATIAGAIGGALATSGLTHVADAAATTPANSALEASIARIDSDVVALKAGLEHTSKTSVSQFNKTSDRLDKIEKAQTEPNSKLARLTEAVEKLRAAPPAAAAPVPAAVAVTPAAARDVTGSVTTPTGAAPLPVQVAAVPAAPPKPEVKPEVNRLPSIDGWTLADVGYGGALIENRRGTYEVYAGDFIPGLGRIDAIRKQDGHWVVVTSKGLILPR